MTTATITARNFKRAAIIVVIGIVTIDVVGGVYHLMTRQPIERCTPAPSNPAGCPSVGTRSDSR